MRNTIIGFFVLAAAIVAAIAIDPARVILLAILLLGSAIVIHEFFHLLTARLLGVGVDAFGLGFGPLLASRKAFGIEWCLRLLPIGGYVSLADEKGHEERADSFARAAIWKRALIMVAGPLSNIASAWLLLFALAWISTGDIAVAVIGAGRLIELIVSVTADAFASWLPHAVSQPLDMPFAGLPGIVTGIGMASEQGWQMVVFIAAALHLSVGFLNLLPVPPLDGGQVALDLIARPDRISNLARRARFARVGMTALVTLIIVVTGIDLLRSLIGYIPQT